MTQNEIILAHLKAHGSITNLEAMQEYGICRLSGRILELRRQGHNIETVDREGKTRYNGRKTVYGEYRLC